MDSITPRHTEAFRKLDMADDRLDGTISRDNVLALLNDGKKPDEPAVGLSRDAVGALAKKLQLNTTEKALLMDVAFSDGKAVVTYNDTHAKELAALFAAAALTRSNGDKPLGYLQSLATRDPGEAASLLEALPQRQKLSLVRALAAAEGAGTAKPDALSAKIYRSLSSDTLKQLMVDGNKGVSPPNTAVVVRCLDVMPDREKEALMKAFFAGPDPSQFRMSADNPGGKIRFVTQQALLSQLAKTATQTSTRMLALKYGVRVHANAQLWMDKAFFGVMSPSAKVGPVKVDMGQVTRKVTSALKVKLDLPAFKAELAHYFATSDASDRHLPNTSSLPKSVREIAQNDLARLIAADPMAIGRALEKAPDGSQDQVLVTALTTILRPLNKTALSKLETAFDRVFNKLKVPADFDKKGFNKTAFHNQRVEAAYTLGVLLGAAKKASIGASKEEFSLIKTVVLKAIGKIPKGLGNMVPEKYRKLATEKVSEFVTGEASIKLVDAKFLVEAANQLRRNLRSIDGIYNDIAKLEAVSGKPTLSVEYPMQGNFDIGERNFP